MSIHTARAGETVASFAARFSVSPEELIRLNALPDPQRLTPGLALYVPDRRESAKERAVILSSLPSAADPEAAGALLEGSSFVCCGCCRVTAEGGVEAPHGAPLARAAAERGAAGLMCLANLSAAGGYSPGLLHALLSDGAAKERLLARVCSLAAEHGFYGAELCFGYILPFDCAAMAEFVELAAQRLHERGLYLFAALCPEGGREARELFAAAAASADYVSVLCRGGGEPFSPPQPLSPLSAQLSALRAAAALAPGEKLLLAAAGCGCSWPRDGAGELISSSSAAALAVSVRSGICFDADEAAAHFKYRDAAGQEREVWFEDARTQLSLLRLIREEGAAGLSLRRADPRDAASIRARRELCRAEKFI